MRQITLNVSDTAFRVYKTWSKQRIASRKINSFLERNDELMMSKINEHKTERILWTRMSWEEQLQNVHDGSIPDRLQQLKEDLDG